MGSSDSPQTVRVELSSEADLFFHYIHYIDDNGNLFGFVLTYLLFYLLTYSLIHSFTYLLMPHHIYQTLAASKSLKN